MRNRSDIIAKRRCYQSQENATSHRDDALRMPITIDSIISGMEWAAENHLAEFAFSAEGHRITIRRGAGDAPLPAQPAIKAAQAAPAAPEADAVTAPLAGLCHLRPESGGMAFVEVGARVEAGQTICVIEAMKMMTAIPAPQAGTVEAIMVGDGVTVEAGAPLMRIR